MLPKWYPNRYDDQDGDFVGRHVAAIAAHGGAVEVAVLFAAVARGPLPTLVVADEDFGGSWPTLRYYYRAAPTGLALLDKPLKLLLYFWCLLRGYRRLRRHWHGAAPALVHVHVLLRTGLFAWALRGLCGIPYLITEHWTRYLPQQAGHVGPVRRWLTGGVVRRAAALHTVSENLCEALARLGATNPRSVVIPNVVDTAIFYPAPVPRPAEVAPRWLLHVAAFSNDAKNQTGLLAVLSRLRATQPTVRLRVAGYGRDEALLKRTATELGLVASQTVEFLGKLTQAEVAAEMRRADVFVLFSNYENLPCVLIEAQASGLPVVATRVGGVAELVPADNSRGLLVAAGDEAALQQALTDVLNAPPGRFDPVWLAHAAVSQFSYAAVGPRFGALYRQILGDDLGDDVVCTPSSQ